jgi:phosphoenolpyruvate carboxykinase (ATP)
VKLRRRADRVRRQLAEVLLLDPHCIWSDPDRYDTQARRLAVLFQENFEQFKDQAPLEAQAAGPRAG